LNPDNNQKSENEKTNHKNDDDNKKVAQYVAICELHNVMDVKEYVSAR
jgi:hypothetical protein